MSRAATKAVAVIVAVIAICAGGSARAEASKEDKAKAKSLYESGEKHFRLGQFQRAVDDWTAGYDAYPQPVFLYNLGQAYRQLFNDERAIFFYKQFLASANDATPEQRRNVEEKIAQLQRAIDEQKKAQEAAPTGPEVAQHPAPNVVTAQLETLPVIKRRPWYREPIGMSLAGAGVALVAVGGGLLGVAGSERSAALAAMNPGDFNNHHQNDLTFEAAGWTLTSVGIASAITGAVILAVKGSHK